MVRLQKSDLKYNFEINSMEYVGTIQNTPTFYIELLEAFINRYGKPYINRRWVCTSSFGFGEGHYISENCIGFDLNSNAMGILNRAFDRNLITKMMQHYHNFNDIPSGGYFNASGFLNMLKEKYGHK